jgi:capsular exopolysaccharide synthesis family protein
MPELTGTKDLRSYLRMFWRWKWVFLLFVVAAPVVSYVVASGQTKEYKSSALVGINSTTVNTSLLNGSSGSFSTSNVTAIAELVTTTPVADLAASLMHPPADPRQIVGEVSASGDQTTNFVTITAQDRNAQRAAAIANAFANAIAKNLQRSAVSQIDSTIKGIRSQLSQLGPNNTTLRPQLQQELNQLLASRSNQGGEAAILQAATPSGSPTGISKRRVIELGLLIGVLLGFGAILVAESADRRLRTPEDLENVTDLPLLGVIEPSAFAGGLATTREDEEAFQMLRTSLMFFNVDKPLDSVVITSAGEKEGKTTVATRLAVAAASSGLDVVMVDADLRRAQVSARLGIGAQEGLGSVLAGTRQLGDVLIRQPLVETAGVGELHVVPAGPPPPNPSALMSSTKMKELLSELEARSDLVIVDTPAALAVSDPLPLMREVSGVVLIARMNQSSRQTIRRLQKIVESAHGNLLGVVATGATAGPGYSHYYPKYYSHNGTNGNGSRQLLRKPRRSAGSATALEDD